MRIRYVASDYHPYGDFSIQAENEQDREILKHFVSATHTKNSGVKFALHSYGGQMGRIDSVFFGWSTSAAKHNSEKERKRKIRMFVSSLYMYAIGWVASWVYSRKKRRK